MTNLPLEHDGCTSFAAEEFQALARFRVGIPFLPARSCGGCGARQDVFGDHALSCPSCGTYARHNLLRDALAKEYNRAGVVTRPEEPLREGAFRIDLHVSESSDSAPEVVDVTDSSAVAKGVTRMLMRGFGPDPDPEAEAGPRT